MVGPALGWNGVGPPKPHIVREGDHLRLVGLNAWPDHPDTLAVVASDPRAYAWGILCPLIYDYPYGEIRWKRDLFPEEQQRLLKPEIDRVRRELAATLATERATWYHVPPDYFQKYAEGEGTIRFWSFRGIAVHAIWIALAVGAIPAIARARRATHALREFDRLATPKCSECGYELTGLMGGVCPECGATVTTHPVHRNSGIES